MKGHSIPKLRSTRPHFYLQCWFHEDECAFQVWFIPAEIRSVSWELWTKLLEVIPLLSARDIGDRNAFWSRRTFYHVAASLEDAERIAAAIYAIDPTVQIILAIHPNNAGALSADSRGPFSPALGH